MRFEIIKCIHFEINFYFKMNYIIYCLFIKVIKIKTIIYNIAYCIH
jgi:hypothetical protein